MRGPAPNPNRRRQNPTLPMTQLPAEGRTGDPPRWPLRNWSETELDMWRELWSMPQAVMWERQRWTRDVAQYVRWKVLAEELNDYKAAAEARALSDRLGLNPMAMLRLRWEIVEDETDERRVDKPALRPQLRAVDGDAVAGT